MLGWVKLTSYEIVNMERFLRAIEDIFAEKNDLVIHRKCPRGCAAERGVAFGTRPRDVLY